MIVTPSCHLPPIPAPRRMPEPTNGSHQLGRNHHQNGAHHRSISVDRRDDSNGMSRLQTARSRAAHIRARSKGQYATFSNGRSFKFWYLHVLLFIGCLFYSPFVKNNRGKKLFWKGSGFSRDDVSKWIFEKVWLSWVSPFPRGVIITLKNSREKKTTGIG